MAAPSRRAPPSRRKPSRRRPRSNRPKESNPTIDSRPLFFTDPFSSLDWLKADDVICPGEEVEIPNTVLALWRGDVGSTGQAFIKWDENISYLVDRGFKVENQKLHRWKGAWTKSQLTNWLSQESKGKSLHGLFFWGHGWPEGFGSNQTAFWVQYSEISRALAYRQGLVIINACYSGYCKGETAKDGLGVLTSEGGKDLVSPNGIFGGHTGILNPVINEHYHVWDLLNPGDQGTKP